MRNENASAIGSPEEWSKYQGFLDVLKHVVNGTSTPGIDTEAANYIKQAKEVLYQNASPEILFR